MTNAENRLARFPKSTFPAAETLSVMAELWPACFFFYDRRRLPLKNGIHNDILAVAAGAITADELRLALRRYCHSLGYLAACKEGAPRIGLDGKVAGHVTAAEAEHAAAKFAKWSRRHKTRPNPAPAPRPAGLGFDGLRAAASARRGRAL